MAKALPRSEGSQNIGINVLGGVGYKDVVGRSLAPGYEFIEEAVRRNASIRDALFGGAIGQ